MSKLAHRDEEKSTVSQRSRAPLRRMQPGTKLVVQLFEVYPESGKLR